MSSEKERLYFASDYMEGAHPAIMQKLLQTNLEKTVGYGLDGYSESARARIRAACKAPEAMVHFLTGGTQTNATVIDAMLKSYQGVISARTGHISVHEAGAIEFGGHKVLTIDEIDGKVTAEAVEKCIREYWTDDNHDHMVMPGMVYLSQPTEYGTIYSLNELEKISRTCHENGVYLYVDGARLAYALACPQNDVTLPDLARTCDAFYIGGTKCGALFGEAVVFPNPRTVPQFFTIVKQHGALLAKGRIAGLQFDTLFTDGLYDEIGKNAIQKADQIRSALREKGYELGIENPTNQVFLIVDNAAQARLAEQVEMAFMERVDSAHVMMRIATSWATTQEDVDQLISLL